MSSAAFIKQYSMIFQRQFSPSAVARYDDVSSRPAAKRNHEVLRPAQAIAQEVVAPSNGPVTSENLESPDALKHVERVNPMSDKFEVRVHCSLSTSGGNIHSSN